MSNNLSDDLLIAVSLALALRKKSKRRSKWAKSWLLKRAQLSHINLLNEIRLEPEDWNNYLRMDEATYFELLHMVTPLIKRKDTVMRAAITPHERLSATLRFLATGNSYADLKFRTAISAQALSEIIPDTCKAIYRVLRKRYLKFPNTEIEWKNIGAEFDRRWQFLNCLGAVDGKHVQITPTVGSGSYFFNYKKSFSLVLMAIANANYEFLLCDIGTNGRVSDGGVIENTMFFEKLVNGELKIPTVNNNELPYVFVGDEAFALRTDFLKPFNQRELNFERKIFNYRLSRARRIIENAFGIMVARFRIFHTPINLDVKHIEQVVMTCCVLHNFLRRECSNSYSPQTCLDEEDKINGEIIPGLRSETQLFGLERGFNRNYGEAAKNVRQRYLEHFNGDGIVEWQNNYVHGN